MNLPTKKKSNDDAMVFIGIDNGIGTIGIIEQSKTWTSAKNIKTPIKKELNYTKAKQNISRLKYDEFKRLLERYIENNYTVKIGLERPMVNPGRFKATVVAVRILEAMLIAIEELNLPFEYIDSRQWQKVLLPHGVKGSAELKKAGIQIAGRLFPRLKLSFRPDADGILIAEYLRRKYNNEL